MSDYDYRKLDIARLLPALGIIAKKSGGLWHARCPNHDEKLPSWTMIDHRGHEDHGIHHCFGCGFQGTALSLSIHVLGVSATVARDWVIEKAIGAGAPPLFARVQLSGMGKPFKIPAGFEWKDFDKWPGTIRRYAEGRGITPEQAAEWGLGYAVAGRLHGRVVIPVRNYHRNQVVNYTARTYCDQEAKYLGASEEERPNLDCILGEEWWPELVQRHTLITVEGGINAMAVQRVTRTPFGAILGSNVRPGHVLRLSTFKRLVVLTDPDAAGDKAAGKMLALGRHIEVVRVAFPPKEDAQSIGPERLREMLAGVGA